MTSGKTNHYTSYIELKEVDQCCSGQCVDAINKRKMKEGTFVGLSTKW